MEKNTTSNDFTVVARINRRTGTLLVAVTDRTNGRTFTRAECFIPHDDDDIWIAVGKCVENIDKEVRHERLRRKGKV